MSKGKQHDSRRLKDGMIEEFNEDCIFPCKYLSNLSPQSTDDALYIYQQFQQHQCHVTGTGNPMGSIKGQTVH